MLPASHSQAYQEFLVSLQKFQICLENLDTEVNTTVVNQQFLALQDLFEQRIKTLTDDDLDGELLSRWRSLSTEMYREFKLLTTDLLFLRTSRQAATKRQRLEKICDRVTKLIAYSRAMLDNAQL
jgi:hypothetical protein